MNPHTETMKSYVLATVHRATQPRGNWVHMPCPICGDRGNHLGYNSQTGQVHCLRCGLSANITGGGGLVKPRKEQEKLSLYYEEELIHGNAEWEYARKRGLIIPDPCLASGSGDAEGCLVFLTWGPYRKVNYLQYRTTDPTSSRRYASVTGTIPRLNHFGNGSILVLTEGPIDAVCVRQCTGIWTSALYGCQISSDMLSDIILADPMLVVIMLDNDEAGRKGTRNVSERLIGAGITISCVKYKEGQPKDAGDMSCDMIIELVSDAIRAAFDENDWEGIFHE